MSSQAASQSKYIQAMSRRQANAMARLGGTDTSALTNFSHMKTPDRTRTADFQGPPKHWPEQARRQWADRLKQMTIAKQKDRIKFWNIVPGDYVRVKRGNVAAQKGLDPAVHKVRPEGKVVQIDRLKNVAFLRDDVKPEKQHESPRLAPTKKTVGAAAQIDYLTGYTSGYTDKVIDVPAPVSYSDLQLRVQTGTQFGVIGMVPVYEFAHRLERGGKVWYDHKTETLRWDRYAILKDKNGKNKRVKVDWPELEDKTKAPEPNMSSQPGQTLRPDVESETWLPWSPEGPIFLPPKAPWQSPYSIAQTAKIIAKMREEGRISEPMTRNQIRGLRWQYQGFWAKKNYKPLPVPQPPTPGEVVAHQKKALAQWYQKHGNSADVRSFAPVDYLQFAPLAGPAAGGSWRLASGPPIRTFERNVSSGKLVHLEENNAASKIDLDAMPIELLMAGDLENRRGLAWRMKRRRERQEAEKRKLAAKAKNDEALLEQFREAMSLQKQKETELETGVTQEQLLEQRMAKGSVPLSVQEREARQAAAREAAAAQGGSVERANAVVAEILEEKEALDPAFKAFRTQKEEIDKMLEGGAKAGEQAETDKPGRTSSS